MALPPPSSPPIPPSSNGNKTGTNIVPIRPGAAHRPPRKTFELQEEAVEEGEGAWIVSYADMMTLLCVFFALMFSMTKPDTKKFEEFKRETAIAFGGQYQKPYQQLVDQLQAVIKQQGLEKVVKIEADEAGVSATFLGTIFFDSGRVDLIATGSDVLTKVGDVIKNQAKGFRIVVEGHTDDVPMQSANFPSNWELSGARAARVVRMFEQMGFDRRFLNAIGYSDTKPIAPNRDAAGQPIPANQSQNRRVVLRIIRDEAVTTNSPNSAAAPAAAAPVMNSAPIAPAAQISAAEAVNNAAPQAAARPAGVTKPTEVKR